MEYSLYELNRGFFSSAKSIAIEEKKKEFKEFLNNNPASYYLLYGREINYFTLFKNETKNTDNFFSVLVECLNNLGGEIKDFYLSAEGAIEIWITLNEKLTSCLLLFSYDTGVEIV